MLAGVSRAVNGRVGAWRGLDRTVTHEKLRRAMAPLQKLSMRVQRARVLTIAVSLAVALVASTCQVVGGYQAFAPHPCDVLPASKPDSTGMATLVLSKQTNGTCYWIDQTEVTVYQYSEFLAKVPMPVVWDPQCPWKTTPSNPVAEMSETPEPPCVAMTSAESEPFRETKPIRCVDWCDARAYCKWAGADKDEDLCGGNPNGSFVEPTDLPDQWGSACSAGGSDYPNGQIPIAEQCNVGLSEAAGQCYSLLGQNQCAPTDVDAPNFAGCTGPSGTVDMIGNVAEWVVSCAATGDGGPDTLCQTRGGSFLTPLDDMTATCYGVAPTPIGARDRAIGLRCCEALSMDEQNLVK
jgi:formylglycine-generating enzyme